MLTHQGTVPLYTKRLTLRRFTVQDAPKIFENWASDDNTTRYLTWDTYTDPQKAEEYLTRCVAEYEKPDYYHWLIEFEGEPIGAINLHSMANKAEHCEVGYCMGSRWWNRGIMTEALRAVLAFAFEQMNANKVCALHDVQNIGSGRVMQKNGMTLEGLLREHLLRRDGTRGDAAFYGILKREWAANTSTKSN